MVSIEPNRAGGDSRPTGRPNRSGSKRSRGRAGRACADGGVGWNDLTGFQRDLLKAIRRCEQEEQIPTGQTIKSRLESQYGEAINNGRLYQNLGYLVECGLLEKGFVDGRTNTYSLAASATVMLDETAHQLANICGIEVAARNG